MSDLTRAEFEAQIVAKAWKDEAFRKQLLADPKGVYAAKLAAHGIAQTLPAGVSLTVVSETPTQLYLVLPAHRAAGAELSDEELASVAGGRSSGVCCGRSFSFALSFPTENSL